MPFLGQIMDESSIDLATKELVIMRVSQLNDCAYCLAAHRPLALGAGVPERDRRDRLLGRRDDALRPRERTMVRWVDQVTLDPHGVTDALTAAALDHFRDDQLIELTRAGGHDLDAQRSTAPRWTSRRPGSRPMTDLRDALRDAIDAGQVGDRLWLYATYHCNLACTYCLTESSPRIAHRRTLDPETMVAAVEQARELGIRRIGITGGETVHAVRLPRDCWPRSARCCPRSR